MSWSRWAIGWPYIGLGGAIVLLLVMFCTRAMRSDMAVSRWRDPVWLAWLVVPMYLLHVFEEYAYDVLGRSNVIIAGVCQAQGYPPYPDCPIPLAHFATVNISLVWVGAPLAALLCRRNPVVGLSFYGFVIFNGLLHVVTGIVGGKDSLPGVVTGTLLFLPSFFWMVYVVLSSGLLSKKALAISLSGGVLAHIYLGASYGLFKSGAIGPAGMIVIDALIAFAPIVVAWAGSHWLGPKDWNRTSQV